MIQKRRVFLFGAGAALEWGAPATRELTALILNSGFKICDNKTTITSFIYQTLLDNGYRDKDVNFETIISVIEELIVYYSNFDSHKKIPSFYKCLFDPKFSSEILNFSIEGNKNDHGYILQIPKGAKYNHSKPSLQNETPEQYFFQHLLGELLTDISARIIDYSYFTPGHSKIDLTSENSNSFVQWMKLHQKQTPLRLYTLNYDRVFKILLSQNTVEVFEGFDCDNISYHYNGLRPNIKRILTDFDGNIHYNLHGSVNWNVEELDNRQLPNAEIFFETFANLPSNNTPASHQMEKGKTLTITNIITGYQKAQKAMISPFKQMQSAFDRDCCFADEIYVIGYSFGDEHLNSSLRTALRHNGKLKVIIVDPFFMKNNIDEEVSIKLFSSVNKQWGFPQKIDKNVHSHRDGSFIAYTMSFKEFRERQLNPLNTSAQGILFP